MPCRINKRRVWAHRIILEASLRADNAFVTLTYDDEHLPPSQDVEPEILQGFLKRLRKNTGLKLRFYGVGEYGDETGRPHYHLALFGYPSCLYGTTRHRMSRCCPSCDGISNAWKFGRIEVGQLETASATYIAGYVTKKLTNRNDPWLEGREPEFSRMSLRPGIGADFCDEIASTLLEHGLDETLEDVPTSLQHGRKKWPLGRYLRQRIRERIGRDKKAPLSTIQKMEEELRPVREIAYASAPSGFKNFAFKSALIDLGEQKRRNITARDNIYRQRKNKI